MVFVEGIGHVESGISACASRINSVAECKSVLLWPWKKCNLLRELQMNI